MITINSLSGGKTSSYMAYHYPADYNLFALVLINSIECKPKDNGLIKLVSDKIGKEFIATAEDDKTLKVILDLEQLIGKEIIWLTGLPFDDVIKFKGGYLPSWSKRYCTTEMKIRPIFDWWYKNINEKVKMGIGYRYDEKERANHFTTKFKGIVGKRKTQNKWQEIEWREGYFPLIENKIFHPTIIKWSQNINIDFPIDSNCVGCFHKSAQQLRKNWENHFEKMNWFSQQEKNKNCTWKDSITYDKIKDLPIQTNFNFGGGSGCNGGFCTD